MVARVLLLGGYGNFGGTLARSLAPDPHLRLLVAGRSRAKAERFIAGLDSANSPEAIALDLDGADVAAALVAAAPDIVIHTVGPFQGQTYRVAEAAIAARAHYLDLADARAFVTGIAALDGAARAAGVAVLSGASSVPCLSAAMIDHHRAGFAQLDSIDFGISAAQQTNRGLATASGILTYVGKPFRMLDAGRWRMVHGWQRLRRVRYPELGGRWFGDCDIPDLDLFPARYPGVHTVRFGAGHEISLLHLATWALSWPVRARLLPPLRRFAEPLLKLAGRFDRLGTARSGMHLFLSGMGHDGARRQVRVFLIARSGHGPHIPCAPAVLLTRRLARGEKVAPGARPCLDLVDLPEYLSALAGLDIEMMVEGGDA